MTRMLTIEETAQLLNVNYYTVYALLERLGAVDLNQGMKGKRLIRIPEKNVEAYLDACAIRTRVILMPAGKGTRAGGVKLLERRKA